MAEWLSENLGTIIISLSLLGLIVLITVGKIKARKAGGSTCGCGCSHCAMQDACHGGHHDRKKQN